MIYPVKADFGDLTLDSYYHKDMSGYQLLENTPENTQAGQEA